MTRTQSQRVIAYIDGFNLYFGLKAKGWQRYYWLNLQALMTNLLKSDQRLVHTRYFTARVQGPPAKIQRQAAFLEALGTLPDFTIYYGQYFLTRRVCRKCGYEDFVPSEKMSDVNIAVELLSDAFKDRFDTALLVSADSDLKGSVETILREFPAKRIVVVFPPARHSVALAQIASAYLTIGRAKLDRSTFPPQVRRQDGFVLQQPVSWK
jgi:uncharacterized LabA/DUF88 family protein